MDSRLRGNDNTPVNPFFLLTAYFLLLLTDFREETMKVLVIGGGGREHAIVWKLALSRHVDKIYCAPGNAGIAEMAECIGISGNNFDELVDLVRYEWIDLTIVGP